MIIPGAFISLCLKFDIDRQIKQKIKQVSQIKVPFFMSNLVLYVVGITITYVYMIWFKHAQPALLYLVPCATVALLFSMVTESSGISEILGYEAVKEAPKTDGDDKKEEKKES